MKNIIVIFITFLILCCCAASFAGDSVCPEAKSIKAAQLVKAFQNSFDPESWDFISLPFKENGLDWHVEFGSFFPDVKNADEALRAGIKLFKKVVITIKNPDVSNVPDFLVCYYVPNGMSYWLSAVAQRN